MTNQSFPNSEQNGSGQNFIDQGTAGLNEVGCCSDSFSPSDSVSQSDSVFESDSSSVESPDPDEQELNDGNDDGDDGADVTEDHDEEHDFDPLDEPAAGLGDAPSALWQRVEAIVRPVVEAEGFKLYDLEPPYRAGAVLRVFIWKGKGAASAALATRSDSDPDAVSGALERSGVILDECARVSKALEFIPALDEAVEGSYILEVSSPGVNRKLSRLEHFESAIGEFAKIVTINDQVFNGPIVEVVDSVISIRDVGPQENGGKKSGKNSAKAQAAAPVRKVPLGEVRRARIDFQF